MYLECSGESHDPCIQTELMCVWMTRDTGNCLRISDDIFAKTKCTGTSRSTTSHQTLSKVDRLVFVPLLIETL